jgi:hypothetical protein
MLDRTYLSCYNLISRQVFPGGRATSTIAVFGLLIWLVVMGTVILLSYNHRVYVLVERFWEVACWLPIYSEFWSSMMTP